MTDEFRTFLLALRQLVDDALEAGTPPPPPAPVSVDERAAARLPHNCDRDNQWQDVSRMGSKVAMKRCLVCGETREGSWPMK